jgi:hypothetical protein
LKSRFVYIFFLLPYGRIRILEAQKPEHWCGTIDWMQTERKKLCRFYVCLESDLDCILIKPESGLESALKNQHSAKAGIRIRIQKTGFSVISNFRRKNWK